MTRRRAASERAHRVRWSLDAESDILGIATYLARESPSATRAVVATLRTNVDELRDFPQLGRVVPELQRLGMNEWRELIVGNYRLVYSVDSGTVGIDLVADTRRDFETILHARILRYLP